jgi:hypothetical protein
MPRPRKFRPGDVITSIAEMDEQLARKGYVFLFGDRPTHAGVVHSQRYRTLVEAIKSGRMRRAMVTDEWAEKYGPAQR